MEEKKDQLSQPLNNTRIQNTGPITCKIKYITTKIHNNNEIIDSALVGINFPFKTKGEKIYTPSLWGVQKL